jgi:hypothetical protein
MKYANQKLLYVLLRTWAKINSMLSIHAKQERRLFPEAVLVNR